MLQMIKRAKQCEVMPSDWLKEDQAVEIVRVWLNAEFDGAERNERRLGKIKEAEENNFK